MRKDLCFRTSKDIWETSLVVQWLRLLPTQRVQVRSLLGEPRSHMPLGQKGKTWNRSNIVTNSKQTLKKNWSIAKKKKKRLKKLKVSERTD